MPDLTASAVERVVATFPVEDLGTELGAAGAAIETSVTDNVVRVRVTLGFPAAGLKESLERDLAGAVARRYGEIARKAAAALAHRPKDQKHKFPKIVVEERK